MLGVSSSSSSSTCCSSALTSPALPLSSSTPISKGIDIRGAGRPTSFHLTCGAAGAEWTPPPEETTVSLLRRGNVGSSAVLGRRTTAASRLAILVEVVVGRKIESGRAGAMWGWVSGSGWGEEEREREGGEWRVRIPLNSWV